MSTHRDRESPTLWSRHAAEWRDPAHVVSQWPAAAAADPRLLRHEVRGGWWEALAATGGTLLVTREYEHLVLALRMTERGPAVSYLPMPHPSGLAVDLARGVVHVASTRNPNQVFDLSAVSGVLTRTDVVCQPPPVTVLLPLRSRILPGCLYLHDLALIGGQLHANAVGQNAVVRLHEDGGHERVWWPRSIETDSGPDFSRNHLQLNSIAAGRDLAGSYFAASTDRIGRRKPGHKNFAVARRGVVFSGATREPVARGLTRPHSTRLLDGRIWVGNSGFGELGVVVAGRFESVARLEGWTRGLCFQGRTAFAGTSRILPRFSNYAPGLAVEHSVCGLHAVDVDSGRVLGSLLWPAGNQIFAIEWVPPELAAGLPFPAGKHRQRARERQLFYAFEAPRPRESSTEES